MKNQSNHLEGGSPNFFLSSRNGSDLVLRVLKAPKPTQGSRVKTACNTTIQTACNIPEVLNVGVKQRT